MSDFIPVGELLAYVIGGGWGDEDQSEGTIPVSVIRGADFPAVSAGDASTLPLRYETTKRVKSRILQPGDIVLEISGGTKDRPTGRTVYVSEKLIDEAEGTLIPASFCRLLRPNRNLIHPRYFYYWLQQMYRAGRTWAYQVQSTGLANFQMQMFQEAEEVRLPPLGEQRRIAGVLGALDDLIDTNRRRSIAAETLATALTVQIDDLVTITEIALVKGTHQTQPAGLVDHYSLPAFDASRLPERVRGDSIKSGKISVSEPTVLISRLNPRIPRIWMAYPQGVAAVASTEFVPLIPRPGESVEEIWALCNADSFSSQLQARVTGTTGSHQRVDKAAILELLVPDVRQLTSAKRRAVASLVQEAHGSKRAARELEQARDELLPLLVSGRVRVKDLAGVVW